MFTKYQAIAAAICCASAADAFSIGGPLQRSATSTATTSTTTMLEMMEEQNQDPSSRREYMSTQFKFLAALSTATAVTNTMDVSSANAFENKISNQYDDRPKRRGPQPKDLNVGTRKDMIGEEYKGLKNCGPAPNCFCSTENEEDDPDHSIPAWKWASDLDQQQAFAQLEDVINQYKPGQGNIDGGGFKIVTSDPKKGYIYVQFESLKAGYIDDVEFAVIEQLGKNTVQVRSSSRVGYLDFGVNAKRLNYIAKMLVEKGWEAAGVDYNSHKGYFAENQVPR